MRFNKLVSVVRKSLVDVQKVNSGCSRLGVRRSPFPFYRNLPVPLFSSCFATYCVRRSKERLSCKRADHWRRTLVTAAAVQLAGVFCLYRAFVRSPKLEAVGTAMFNVKVP